MSLFSRKPGGTMLGNLIRGAVKTVPGVGPMLGNGAMMISQEEYDLKNLPDNDYIAKYGKTKTGQFVAGVVPNPAIKTVEQQKNELSNLGKQVDTGKKLAFLETFKKYWYLVVLPVVGLIIYLIVRKKGNRRRR